MDAEGCHRPRTVILDYDVCRPREPRKGVASTRRLQVNDDAAFAAVDGVEAGTVAADSARHLARRVARRRLDFDDVGAEVREQHRAERTGHYLGDVEDAKASESGLGHLVIWKSGNRSVH